MSEQIWYVYQNGQQLGPFANLQVKQMIDSKMIPQDAYIFKVGWKDWRPIEETFSELGLPAPTMPAGHSTIKTVAERRDAAPRATISGRVVVHNNSQMVIGSGVNISSTGMFVETTDQMFAVGERLKISVRVDGFSRPFNVLAQVVRYNGDPQFPVGYGLRFDDIDPAVAKDIQQAIDRQNQARAATQQAAR